ncbi:hypothetical protein O181_110159 [Austropuccinia psidii MF-1]|uniref:Uncharacterized protein n=1 Tax=Austropuccinia psidii MF-1 TaxID=1389203 RepID=A0A9Q3JZG8_9BASI|nr:hypothetical protein [Austropuccinia psidii MF-1]
MVCGPWGLLEAPWAQFSSGPRASMRPKIGPWYNFSPTWPKPIERFQDHQDPGLPKAAGETLVGNPSSNSSAQPLAKRFQRQLIPSTTRTFQPVLSSIPNTIPPSSPSTSHAMPALNPAVRPSPIQQPRNSPIPPPNNSNLWPVPLEEGMVCLLGVSCLSSFSKKRLLAYPNYQRRSQFGE